MAKNRTEFIQAAKDILNWDVTDPVFTALCVRFTGDAYKRVGSECPTALYPDEIRRTLPASYVSGAGEAVDSTISGTADPFVLEFSPFATSSFSPVENGTWNGAYWLEITLPDGSLWRGQCREFWTVGGTNRYVSIDRPWTMTALSDANYRLHVPYLWLRDDYEEVLLGQRFGSNGSPLTTTPIGTAIFHDQWSNQNSREWGYPDELRRENHYQHPSPNIAPLVSVEEEQGTWGNEPWGEFEYCFTYIWGYQEADRKSPSGGYIPLFESSASPTSASATITNAGEVVVLTLPNVAWQLNYGDSGTLRYGKSGWKKRLYRRRISTTGGSNPSIEYPNVFQFLADVDDLTTSYIDNGSIVPDYTIRLNDIHGYYGWSMWPLPTDEQAMEYQLRATRRPAPLLNGNDSPRIVPSCEDALTFYLVAYIARHDKDVKTAELYEAKAAEVLEKYRSRHANPTGIVPREAWDGGGANTGWPRARL